MATRYFKDYLNRLEEQYQTSRKAYKELTKALAELDKTHQLNLSPEMQRRLSAAGKNEMSKEYTVNRGRLMRELESLETDFDYTTKQIRGEIERDFRRLYDADENKVDLRAVEIIKSGILSDAELKRMAERYRTEGNNTMFRLTCTAAKGRKDSDMKTLASYANTPLSRRDLELYDNLASAYHMALRPREVAASNAIDARLHDMAYSQTLEMGKGIKIEDAEGGTE